MSGLKKKTKCKQQIFPINGNCDFVGIVQFLLLTWSYLLPISLELVSNC